MKAKITILPGDGIGPEVTSQARRVLEETAAWGGHNIEITEKLIGGAAMDAVGDPMPTDTWTACQEADAVLLGAVGGPKWDDPNAAIRPEQALFKLRKGLGLFANIRPVTIYPSLTGASPLKEELLQGVDLVVVRELTGGIYFGEKRRTETEAHDTCSYTVGEIERIVRVACELAMKRGRKLTSVDKANVLDTSRLWRATAQRVVDEYPQIQKDDLLVDAAAMHLIRRPADFDVIVTENMFGDILTDEASMLAGSMGMLPSASLGEGSRGVYEPIHGSAPDIAGQGIANPYAAILSVAMMFRYSFNLEEEARRIEAAVEETVARGILTPDLAGEDGATTTQVGDAVLQAMTAAVS